METEMDAGKPQKQSLAIAYAMKKKSMSHEPKMAEGGFIGSHQSPTKGHTIHINVHPQGNVPEPGDYAQGGSVEEGPAEKANKHIQGIHRISPAYKRPGEDHNKYGKVSYGESERFANKDWEKDRHNQVIEESRSMPKPNLEGLAEGGMAGDQTDDHEMDMVDRIMAKRMPKDEPAMMSEGGMMANKNSGESTSDPDSYAKADANEFDDLALRDDLEFKDTASNSGDEDGSKLNQDDEDEDMVGRIMKKRMK